MRVLDSNKAVSTLTISISSAAPAAARSLIISGLPRIRPVSAARLPASPQASNGVSSFLSHQAQVFAPVPLRHKRASARSRRASHLVNTSAERFHCPTRAIRSARTVVSSTSNEGSNSPASGFPSTSTPRRTERLLPPHASLKLHLR